jgi:predicted DNA-binding protein (MmcQ/YjbR family)
MANRKLSAVAGKLREKALSYPGTEESFPWGEHAFKVKGKTFVFMRDGDEGTSFSVKLARSRDEALALPGAEPTHYGMGAKGWVTLRPTSRSSMKQLYAFIDESFRAVAPKRLLRELDA